MTSREWWACYEAQRLAVRGAVEHDDLVAFFAPELFDVIMALSLFHAREDGQLLGLHS